ncbi:MAG: hypothetical protein WBQ34_10900 [Candidatus Acidiferrales bacterium]
MSEIAIGNGQLVSSVRAGAAPITSASEVAMMREKLAVLRDVMISLGMQLVFRATILLRRWNY